MNNDLQVMQEELAAMKVAWLKQHGLQVRTLIKNGDPDIQIMLDETATPIEHDDALWRIIERVDSGRIAVVVDEDVWEGL